jgi:peptidoglycan/LPS O-acetylase OafA/YrhL
MKMNRPEYRNPWHWVRVLFLLLMGVAIGCLGAFVQEETFSFDVMWGTLTVPLGMIIVLAALTSSIRAGAWGSKTRLGAWSIFAGWLIATIAFSAKNESGDLIITSGPREIVYVLAGVILGAFAATLPVRKESADPMASVK